MAKWREGCGCPLGASPQSLQVFGAVNIHQRFRQRYPLSTDHIGKGINGAPSAFEKPVEWTGKSGRPAADNRQSGNDCSAIAREAIGNVCREVQDIASGAENGAHIPAPRIVQGSGQTAQGPEARFRAIRDTYVGRQPSPTDYQFGDLRLQQCNGAVDQAFAVKQRLGLVRAEAARLTARQYRSAQSGFIPHSGPRFAKPTPVFYAFLYWTRGLALP